MRTTIIVHPSFDRIWPFAADRVRELLAPYAPVEFIRVSDDQLANVSMLIAAPHEVHRLISLGAPINDELLDALPALEEAFIEERRDSEGLAARLDRRGIRSIRQPSEGYWSQSVSEFALGLTIAGLRRIPQTHHSILSSQDPWLYPLQQFGDDPRFANGTVAGKRVRIVGAGNIASRYASFMTMLGADVAAWDPYATEPSFHRAGSRREYHLDKLVRDAEIFAPMVPFTPGTEGLVTAAHIDALPVGCLVVQVTRARVCDVNAIRRRVLADELSLAADVFDEEPLPLSDPLLGRQNVVHTPHNAGRTKEANASWALALVEQFPEFKPLPHAPGAQRT